MELCRLVMVVLGSHVGWKHGGTIVCVHTARLAKLSLDEKDLSGEVSKGIHPSGNG